MSKQTNPDSPEASEHGMNDSNHFSAANPVLSDPLKASMYCLHFFSQNQAWAVRRFARSHSNTLAEAKKSYCPDPSVPTSSQVIFLKENVCLYPNWSFSITRPLKIIQSLLNSRSLLQWPVSPHLGQGPGGPRAGFFGHARLICLSRY